MEEEKGLPHARGGVSKRFHAVALSFPVFPTHVGVFPLSSSYNADTLSLPHARGGVSTSRDKAEHALFVFPTHVGVFLGEKDLPSRL